MDILPVQSAIVAQLAGAFAGTTFTAQEFPEVEAEFQRAVPNGITYVGYTGSETVGSLSTDPVVQQRRLKFNIECYSRKLYDETGMYAMRKLVESAIIGFMPPSCDRVYLVKDEISRGEDTIWSHVYNVECLTVLVQDNFSEPIVVTQFTGIAPGTVDFTEDYSADFGEGQNH